MALARPADLDGHDVGLGDGLPQRALPGGMRSMAIIHSAQVSGPSRSLERELRWLSTQGDLNVLLPGHGFVTEQFSAFADVESAACGPLTFPNNASKALVATAGLYRQQAAIRDAIRAAQPGVLLLTSALMPTALIAARRESVPTILYAGEILDQPRVASSGIRRRAGERLLGLAAASATTVIACSDRVARQYRARGARDVRTIPPPIDSRYAGGDGVRFRERHGIAADAPLLLAVGAITHGRGQDVLIRALPAIRRAFPDVRCAIVGAPHPRGVDYRYLRDLNRLADEIVPGVATLTGFEASVEDAYAAADVFVNPTRYEAFGRAAFEALLAGCPVVSTAAGAIPEVLRDGVDAVITSPDDPRALSHAVVNVLSDDELAAQLVGAGASRTRAELTAARALAAFQETVASVARPAAAAVRA